jgi:predicted phage terminase large subunit-like protein
LSNSPFTTPANHITTVDLDGLTDDEFVEYVANLEHEAEGRAMHASLHAFVKGAWHIIEPEHVFVDNWHVHELCRVLEDMTFTKEAEFRAPYAKDVQVASEHVERAIFNVPPGTMKTLLISVLWPCWLWARNSKLRILSATYSDKRALDSNIKARNIIKSKWFQSYWSVDLDESQDAKGRYDTKAGGWRIATSVGGEGTGLHPDIIIIDDASTAMAAQSDVERKAVSDWFSNTVSSRGVSRNVAIVVIGQRLHEDDLSGFLLNGPNAASWHHVCLPMRYEPTREATDRTRGWTAYKNDPRTQAGELLWPDLFDEAKVHKLELDLVDDASGQLQQDPTPVGGLLFKVENFKFYEATPARMRCARGWDTGGTENGGDPTAGVKLGEELNEKDESTGCFYVLDVATAQLAAEGVEKLIVTTTKLDGADCAQREEREGGSSGKAVTNARARSLAGYDYEEVLAGNNKIVKSKPFRAQVNAGNVYLPKGAPWVRAYVAELRDFPNAKHDDQVDGSAIAFNALVVLKEQEGGVLAGKATW